MTAGSGQHGFAVRLHLNQLASTETGAIHLKTLPFLRGFQVPSCIPVHAPSEHFCQSCLGLTGGLW